MKVGIIGSGGAGLCALKHALSKNLKPVVWEQSTTIGGTWVYNENVGCDKFGLPNHSSMYQNLKTNLPKEVMAFPDFPFSNKSHSFLHHSEVLQYLIDYAENFSLMPHIQFCHHVELVEPIEDSEADFVRWKITIKNLITGTKTVEIYDAVMVCNGHYSDPLYPKIENISKFQGKSVHSHYYRAPDGFKDMTVVLLGAGASGVDIAVELCSYAKKVFLSHNLPLPFPSDFPANLKQVKGIVEATEAGFILKDGSYIEADAVLFCTGYHYTFPFLSDSCGIRVVESRVEPLYKHMINTKFPSMSFIGIPIKICPFPLFDVQVQFFLNAVKKEVALPTGTEMNLDTANELKQKLDNGVEARHFHQLGTAQWSYIENLVQQGNLKPLPTVLAMIHNHVRMIRRKDLMNYKSDKYKIFANDRFECVR